MKIKKNDKIFLAGHRGFVGSAIYQKLKIEGFKKIVTVDKKNLNLLDQKNTFRFIKKHKPKLVIICAAKVGGIKANINYGADFIYENLQVQNNLIYGSYVNGVKKSLVNLSDTTVFPRNQWLHIYMELPTLSSGILYFGNRYSFDEPLAGRLATIQFYDRQLLPFEIQQNYDAMRGRYS